MSDIDTAAVDSLKVLDPNRPIREATRILLRRDWSLRANRCHMHRSKFHRYSITSSARASSDGGIVRPSAFAAFKLMTTSNLVG